jgi:hypothetical protein
MSRYILKGSLRQYVDLLGLLSWLLLVVLAMEDGG